MPFALSWGSDEMINLVLSLLIALAIDAIIGDPQWRFHPVRLVGRAATYFERIFRNAISNEATAGVVTWCLVLLVTMAPPIGLIVAARRIGNVPFIVVSTLCVYFSIAPRDLANHAAGAARALHAGKIHVARERTGLMVSRDVSQLGPEGLTRAVIESTAENVVDGVTASILFFALFGPLGTVFHRVVNTMDAMFGYKNKRYVRFGRFAARADDVCGWLPARFTGPIFCLSALFVGGRVRGAFQMMLRDHKKHESPNGGIVESAAAGALGIRLGGPGKYSGTVIDKPFLGDPLREPTAMDIGKTIIMMYGTTVMAAIISSALIFAKCQLVERLL